MSNQLCKTSFKSAHPGKRPIQRLKPLLSDHGTLAGNVEKQMKACTTWSSMPHRCTGFLNIGCCPPKGCTKDVMSAPNRATFIPRSWRSRNDAPALNESTTAAFTWTTTVGVWFTQVLAFDRIVQRVQLRQSFVRKAIRPLHLMPCVSKVIWERGLSGKRVRYSFSCIWKCVV